MLRIRQAERADVPQIVALLYDDPQGSIREDLSDAALPRYLAAFDEMGQDDNCTLLIADFDGQIAGYLQMNVIAGLSHRGTRRCLIEDIRIAADRRGQGYGRQLLQAALRRAAEQGCGLAELFAHTARDEARAFYLANGFTGDHHGFRRTL